MARAANDKAQNYTVFGEETEFSGLLSFTDNLEIAGKFKGTIEATGNLEFAKTAVCKADSISAHSIVINGEVTANMTAEESIEMQTGSKINGNIVTSKLRIDDGVDFDGQITMLETKPDVDIFSYGTGEIKYVLTGEEHTTEKHE